VPEPEEFGRVFTPNMFRMIHRPGRGWHHREIVPLENLSLHPATAVLHYGQEVFEGLKAYRLADGAVALFRPELHARRMRASCERMAIPPVEPEDFLSAVKALVSFDQASVPRDPRASLYIRPVCFGSQVGLGVHAASEFLFLVFACIVGQYSGATARPMRVLVMRDLVRAVRGGTGAAKTAGNYAGSLLGIERAKERGFDQVLWLDALELAFIEELGAMNFFAVFGRHLVTPPAGATILAGVTRASILELAPALGLTAEERPLPLEEVLEGARTGDLTEAFAAGTAAVVSPVGEIADGERVARVGGPRMGEVTRSLAAALAEIRAGKDPYGWMVRV
jgi:branched-chain amino acid aminotransferase